MVKGYTGNGATLALFVFSFELGQGKLSGWLRGLLFAVVSMQIVVDAASFILAGTLVKLGVIGAGYTLGSQKIPWKSGLVALAVLTVLHAGKADMRQKYWTEGVQGVSELRISEYPNVLIEWIENGFRVLKTGKTTEDQNEMASASERGAMVAVFLKVLDKTPATKPFLEGETYENIPSLLVPRIFNKEKGIAHIGNWILSYYYDFLSLDQLGKTSIGFDLMIEAYANYGSWGVVGLAVVLGALYGWISRLSIGVPLLSFRFLMAVVVLSGTLASNNTAGVFVTTLWQSLLALLTLNFLLMKSFPNPLFVKAEVRKDKGYRISDMGNCVAEGQRSEKEGSGRESATDSHLASTSQNLSSVPQKHERPTRYVYGVGKKG